MRDDIAQQKEAEDDVNEPKWLQEIDVHGHLYGMPGAAIPMLLAHVRELREALARQVGECMDPDPYTCIDCITILNRQEPPEVE